MALDLTAGSHVLKTRYIPPIREQLNQSTVLLARIGRDDNALISGKNFTVPLHISRNAFAGSGRADGGTSPSNSNQGYQEAVIPNSYTYTVIKVTGPVIRAARDAAGAFITAVESEIKGALQDHKRSMNRQLNSDGLDALAYWTTTDDTSGTKVDDKQGNPFVHLPKAGTTICDLIADSDHATLRGTGITVTRTTDASDGVNITWTGTVASSNDNDALILQGTLGLQMMGIRGIIDDADPVLLSGGLHGLTVASNPWWKAQVFGNSGTKRDISLDLLQQPITAIETESDYEQSDIAFMMSHPKLRDAYLKLLTHEKRFINTMELDGGFKALEYNGLPWVTDPQCDRGKVYYIVTDTMKIFRTSDFDWMEDDGAVLSRVVGEDSYVATLFHYGNLGCLARNGNGVLRDLND